MSSANRLYVTMIVRTVSPKRYSKVCKIYCKIINSPRQQDRFNPIEIVAFSSNKDVFDHLSKIGRGQELIVSGKREFNTFNGKTMEQLILDTFSIADEESQSSKVEQLVSNF
ncbi:MAG: hypothetical protein LC687_06210 [Actinobacteria bacterium]|nr:hypothetical protein [Actinomycetota bacterium]